MKRIRAVRKAKGMTQMDVAALAGLYPSDVSRAERGITWGQHAERIAEVLGLDPRTALDEVDLDVTVTETATNHSTEGS